MNDFFRRYLLPGFVFESAVIAGGYATGRELVEFFLPAGPWGGVLGMIVSMLFWSAVLMVSFELARMAKAYDYRSFFKLLLGRGWFLFEIAYFLLMIIVLAVMGAAAGEITHDLFGLPKLLGSMGMIAATGLMLFYSNTAIEKFLALSVGYLYLVYIVFFVWSFVAFGDRIEAAFAVRAGRRRLVQGGHHVCRLQRRDDSGRVLLHPPPDAPARSDGRGPARRAARHAAGCASSSSRWSATRREIANVALPSAFLLGKIGAPWFEWAFQIAVLLTLVDTGVAMLHAINERVAKVYEERQRPMPRAMRPAIAITVMVISVYAAGAIGLVDLIAKGYGWLTYAFIVLLIIPVLTDRRVADHKAAWRFASTRCRRKNSASVVVDLTRFGILRQP